jgi:hypothetical protein
MNSFFEIKILIQNFNFLELFKEKAIGKRAEVF